MLVPGGAMSVRSVPFFALLSPLLVGLVGCGNGKSDDSHGGDTCDCSDTDDSGEPASSFVSGQYRVSSLQVVTESTVGFDVDGDGEIENKFPSILTIVSALVGPDLAPDAFNETLATAIEKGTLILLVDARYVESDLTYDLLLGASDKKGTLSVDEEATFDDHGVPYGRMTGIFESETAFSTGPNDIQVPVTFMPGEPALMVPLDRTVSEGTLDDAATATLIGGAIPVDMLIAQVVAPIIPKEGYNGQSKEELLKTITSVANDENVSDVELDDGSRAFSAALTLEAAATTW
jgi:hypothetical protein